MPVSPFQRGAQEQPEGGSVVGGKKRRHQRQKLKDRYAHAREDAQLAGLIPTTPEEALKPERVPPSAQSNVPMPELIAQAIKRGWKVDEEMKPHLVQELIDIVMGGEAELKHKIAAFKALQMADKDQFERDHPTDKSNAGGAMTLNVQVVNVDNPAPVVIPQEEGGAVQIEVVPSAAGDK